MSVARASGNRGLADILASRIVRSRGRCEYPGCYRTDVVWAHVVRRRYSATRCMEDGAWALCPTHHDLVDNWANEFMLVVRATIGIQRYEELQTLAEAHKDRPITSTMFWRDECERLKARCVELGIDTRRKVPA